MWIWKSTYTKLTDELQLLRTQLAVREAMDDLRNPPPAAAPAPEQLSSKPIDRAKTERLKELLDGGTRGTKWRKYQRKAEEALRTAPKEITVNTPATTQENQ
jgi:hypothetical protein